MLVLTPGRAQAAISQHRSGEEQAQKAGPAEELRPRPVLLESVKRLLSPTLRYCSASSSAGFRVRLSASLGQSLELGICNLVKTKAKRARPVLKDNGLWLPTCPKLCTSTVPD